MRREVVRYGAHHAQVASLWCPDGASADLPVVVLLHGGFWRQVFTRRLMHRLARAVVARGWAAYNVEYRRVGHFGAGGWPETFHDVSDAIDALDGVAGVDRRRVATCGHSAGGHLALWAATTRATGPEEPAKSHPVRVQVAVSLAGVVDLVAGARLNLGAGAVPALMGGGPDEFPERYDWGSPAARLPLGVPQILVHGLSDTTVPASLSEAYVRRAQSLGDDAAYVPLTGATHLDMIDPHGAAFGEVARRLERRFAQPSP